MSADLEATYSVYNKRYFGGRLPTIPVRWSKTIDKDHAAEFVTYVDGSMAILIIPQLKKFERNASLTLLHEMCHVHLRNAKGDLHGRKFQREMKRLARIGAFNNLW